jgi:hypothetical protein
MKDRSTAGLISAHPAVNFNYWVIVPPWTFSACPKTF